ncbi:MAG: protein kinase domain-containing protein [Verrucomicrobiales bacterium]
MENQPEAILYQCVCGAALSLHPGVPAKCDACGRHYSDEAITVGGMETLRVAKTEGTARTEPSGTVPTPTPESDPLIGTTLGHFKIIDRLGSGGMGAVYRALDESLQRYVALKVIFAPRPSVPGENETGTSTQDRHIGALLREARAQARVRHPNVVHIYYVSRDADAAEMPFLAMELVEGGTLADGLSIRLPTFAETVEIALQATEALRQSAKYDIVHGDVKPSNILLDTDGTVRLSDFGIARQLSSDEPTQGSGTPNYMAPEIWDGSAPDSRSDQYSLGVMLFGMTFGKLPYSFPGDSLDARKEAHRTFVPEFPDPWLATLPEGWKNLLQNLLAKDPGERFPDYESLIAALRTLRPISLPPAGRLIRTMAWATDNFLALAIAGLLLNVPIALGGGGVTKVAMPLIGAGVLVAITFLQMRWGNSLGKKLFQIGIVDLHGLPPGSTKQIYRTFFQYSFVWILVATQCIGLLGIQSLVGIVGILGLIFLTVDGGFGFFRRDRRSLHDLIFDTKVALSAHPLARERG